MGMAVSFVDSIYYVQTIMLYGASIVVIIITSTRQQQCEDHNKFIPIAVKSDSGYNIGTEKDLLFQMMLTMLS